MTEINSFTSNNKLYQQRLNKLVDAPIRLYYTGVLQVYNCPIVAIVGSRKPTPYGEEMTYKLAHDLAKRGVVIVSGLAIGVDGIAHRAALDAGGTTLAIMAGGLDAIYPRRHHALAQRILASGGGLISEYPPGAPCLPHQFVARNRIVAALSDGVIVTEAAAKSGTLHTAGFALDMGITVMTVPGLATNPLASGCLSLLKTGATLVTGADDVLFALGYHEQKQTQLPLLGDTPEETKILELLASGLRDGEELLVRSQLEPSLFSQTLTMLEIQGKIRALTGNQWAVA